MGDKNESRNPISILCQCAQNTVLARAEGSGRTETNISTITCCARFSLSEKKVKVRRARVALRHFPHCDKPPFAVRISKNGRKLLPGFEFQIRTSFKLLPFLVKSAMHADTAICGLEYPDMYRELDRHREGNL